MPEQKPQVIPPKNLFGKTYNFRLRQYKEGSFSGLWELCVMNGMGHVVKTISDADALTYCMENMQGELENDGF